MQTIIIALYFLVAGLCTTTAIVVSNLNSETEKLKAMQTPIVIVATPTEVVPTETLAK